MAMHELGHPGWPVIDSPTTRMHRPEFLPRTTIAFTGRVAIDATKTWH